MSKRQSVRMMPIPDWTNGPNWRQRRVIRYPPNANGAIITDDNFSGKLTTKPELRGRKVTSDENHGLWVQRTRLRGPFAGDIGGNFTSYSFAVISEAANQHTYGGDVWFSNWLESDYHGPIYAVDPNSLLHDEANLKNLRPLGTKAIAEIKPTNNVANLAVDIAEIFHGQIPKLPGVPSWKGRTNLAKAAGDEYLNSAFGWEPLAADMRDVAYAAANAHKLLSAYERNSGKVVRRRYEFPVETTEVTEVVGPSDGFLYTSDPSDCIDFSKPRPVLYKTTKTYSRVWFSGAFTYHLPAGYNSRNGMVSAAAKAGPLLGIELTPEVVWNALPWTWAADWFSNAGDVVSNLSDWAVDGLVMKWGYIMEHCSKSTTYTLVGTPRFKPYGTCHASPVTVWSEFKRREKATPFGFEIDWNGLSPRQLAISAALGITRVF